MESLRLKLGEHLLLYIDIHIQLLILFNCLLFFAAKSANVSNQATKNLVKFIQAKKLIPTPKMLCVEIS